MEVCVIRNKLETSMIYFHQKRLVEYVSPIMLDFNTDHSQVLKLVFFIIVYKHLKKCAIKYINLSVYPLLIFKR